MTTFAFILLLTRTRDTTIIERWVPRDVPGAVLAIPLFTGAAIGWSFLGLLLGSFYEVGGFATKPGFAGAPSGAFALLILAFAWLPLVPLLVFARRFWPLWSGLAFSFIAAFGWLMPLLAER
ncbi:MAG: hypothetical protein ABIP13_01075 [Tepidiformaceae bacterium]